MLRLSWRKAALAILPLLAAIVPLPRPGRPPITHDVAEAIAPAAAPDASQSNATLPLYFEPNAGQTDGRARFLSRGNGFTLFLTSNAAVIAMTRRPPAEVSRRRGSRRRSPAPRTGRSPQSAAVRISFEGARPHPEIEGLDPLAGRVNYFLGSDPTKWRAGMPAYARVRYRAVWPGVDVVYYGSRGILEYDLMVAPGADPGAIRLGIEGADPWLDSAGDVVLGSAAGELRLCRLRLYQEGADGAHRAVKGRFVRIRAAAGGTSANTIGLEVAPAGYDRTRPLVIDPQLVYATYLGGSGGTSPAASSIGDQALDVAIDSAGNVYLTGLAYSTNFPTTVGPSLDPGIAADTPVSFVARLNPAQSGASSLVYSTFLGGSGNPDSMGLDGDEGHGIAVDASGRAYVTGLTYSDNFPTTPGAFQTGNPHDRPDDDAAFVSVLDPTGSSLVYSTYLGGRGYSEASRIALVRGCKSDCAAYVAGDTGAGNFPTPNGFQPAMPDRYGNEAGFVSVITPDGRSLAYSTFLGGSGTPSGGGDGALGIAADSSGNAYVTGYTSSKDFPTLHAFQAGNKAYRAGEENGFVAKLKPAIAGKGSLVYSSYLGGSGAPVNPGDFGIDIDTDPAGRAFVTGLATSADFPTTKGAFQRVNRAARSGGMNAFVSEVATGGSSLLYSTLLGGSGGPLGVFGEAGEAVRVDTSGHAFVTGAAGSTDFPTTAGACQPANRSARSAFNAFVTELNPAAPAPGAQLVFSTYFGGSVSDDGEGLALDRSGNIYVSGYAQSDDLPITFLTAYQAEKVAPSSQASAFLAEINPASGCPAIAVSPATINFASVGVGTPAVTRNLVVKSTGKAPLEGSIGPLAAPFSVVGNPGVFSLDPGHSLTVQVQFNPQSAGTFQQAILIASDDESHPNVSVQVSGVGAPGILSVPAKLDFGAVGVGKSKTAGLVLKDVGLGVLTGNVDTSGLSAPFAVVSGAGPFSLSAGKTLMVTIRFSPTSATTTTQSIVITTTSSAPPKRTTVSVTGKGM